MNTNSTGAANAHPAIGDTCHNERLGVCTIIAVHGMGTIDVQASDGRCYRITGLPTVQRLPQPSG